jgi:hypothetical protein
MQTLSAETVVALLTFFGCFYGYHAVYFYISRRHARATRKGRMRQAVAGALMHASNRMTTCSSCTSCAISLCP